MTVDSVERSDYRWRQSLMDQIVIKARRGDAG